MCLFGERRNSIKNCGEWIQNIWGWFCLRAEGLQQGQASRCLKEYLSATWTEPFASLTDDCHSSGQSVGQGDCAAAVLSWERKVKEIITGLGPLSFPDKSGYRLLHTWDVVLHLSKEERAHQWIVIGSADKVFVHAFMCISAFGS